MDTVSASIDGVPVTTRTAMKMEDSLQAFAVRAACFIGELDVPYTEEFDGHDFGATHIVAYLGEEPVGAVRMRWFQAFAMPERLCVIQRFRGHDVGQLLLERCRKLAESRGCNTLYVHVLPQDQAYWEKRGWRRLDPDAKPAMNGTIALVRPVDPAKEAVVDEAPEIVTLRQEAPPRASAQRA
ncbi:MAG: GNAT family N-acetyltransferase [Reyranellaceae bacterium]